ncbi:Hexaprenyldihydroxybenzoate methyltransferase, mitochondrial [Agyrium rufum]|nr:Hexaprenyldihydroxybenzoate methyltransferase, mitochondrial [Agyrium rufum]
MNPLRHDFIRRCIPTSPHSQDLQLRRRKLRYLDVGCGGGIFAESAARLHDTASVTAIDPSPVVLAIAKAHSKNDPLLREQGRLTYENVSIEGLNIPTTEAEQYDILSLFEVIEHISHPAPFLQSCLPFVKPGGWIVMSTIARSWTSWLTTKIVAEDVVGLVPKGTHDWNKYINPEELRGFFEGQREWGNGTNGMKVMGVVYVPGFGWREVQGSEGLGNYFFAVQKGQIEATTR